MPRVRPLGITKVDYEKNFGIDMDSAIKKSVYSKEQIGQLTGITKRMVYEKIRKPSKISLEWLKLFIKITNMHPNYILEYLYEGKYRIPEKEKEKGA